MVTFVHLGGMSIDVIVDEIISLKNLGALLDGEKWDQGFRTEVSGTNEIGDDREEKSKENGY